MNHAGGGRWRAFSAGSKPTGRVNPLAVETLSAHGINAAAARSKSWDEFAGAGAPAMDVVVTVCDNAAAETCPVWPTRAGAAARKLHWSFPDPTAATGSIEEKRAAFARVFADIKQYIDSFLESGQ